MNPLTSWKAPARFGLAAAALLLLAFLVSVWVGYPAKGRGPPLRLTLADASQPVFALVYIAEVSGFFRAEGVEVEFQPFALGRDAILAVLDGKADLATVFTTPVVNQIYRGRDVCIVSTLHISRRGFVILARRDRDIARPSDLRGKRIGITSGTSTEFFLSLYLATAGIPAGEVTVVPVEPAGYEKALGEGGVDALVAYNPYLFSLPRALGPDRLVTLTSDVYTESSVLAARCEGLPAKREAVQRFLKAIVRAQDFLERNREEGLEIVVKRLGARYDEEAIRAGWDRFRAQARLDNVLVSRLTQEAQWLRDTGKAEAPVPDFSLRIASEHLRAVRPGAVTLLARPANGK